MRSTIIAAALVAGVAAKPLVVRDVVYETQVVTAVVTVTGGAPQATETQQAAVANPGKNWWNGWFPAHATTTAAPKPTYHPKANPAPQPSVKVVTVQPKPTTQAKPKPTVQAEAAQSSQQQQQSSPQSYAAGSIADVAVRMHNLARSNTTNVKVTWDASLAAQAQRVAETCVYGHDITGCHSEDNEVCGQNIAAGAAPKDFDKIVMNSWTVGEFAAFEPYQGQADVPMTGPFEQFGHYTQVMWEGTTKVGCYVADCTSKGLTGQGIGADVAPYNIVCNYAPPGNYPGQFAKNVKTNKLLPPVSL